METQLDFLLSSWNQTSPLQLTRYVLPVTYCTAVVLLVLLLLRLIVIPLLLMVRLLYLLLLYPLLGTSVTNPGHNNFKVNIYFIQD